MCGISGRKRSPSADDRRPAVGSSDPARSIVMKQMEITKGTPVRGDSDRR